MIHIKPYIEELKESGMSHYEISEHLGVSVSMVSSYIHRNFDPSINVAIRVYLENNTVLHPFAEESLAYEIQKGVENEKLRRTRTTNN